MPTRPERYPANRLFVLLATAFALLFAFLVVVLAIDQERVRDLSESLQQQTVPKIIRFQRLARNVDQLRQEGERIFSSDTPEDRQQSLYLVMLVASHPGILEHPQAAAAAREAEAFLAEDAKFWVKLARDSGATAD